MNVIYDNFFVSFNLDVSIKPYPNIPGALILSGQKIVIISTKSGIFVCAIHISISLMVEVAAYCDMFLLEPVDCCQ